MILVECKPDRELVKCLFPHISYKSIRCANGRPNVVRNLDNPNHQVLRRYRKNIGIVDADPGETKSRIFQDNYTLVSSFDDCEISIYKNKIERYLIELNPRLEEWIYTTAKEERIDVRDYDLPEDAERFKEIINANLENYKTLLPDIEQNKRMKKLKHLLEQYYEK